MCDLFKVAIGYLGRVSEVFVAALRHTGVVEIRKIWHAIGHFLSEAWNRGLDEPDARRQLDSRARRIFDAIMFVSQTALPRKGGEGQG